MLCSGATEEGVSSLAWGYAAGFKEEEAIFELGLKA